MENEEEKKRPKVRSRAFNKRTTYLFEGFEQLGPLVLHTLSGLLLQLPQQRSD